MHGGTHQSSHQLRVATELESGHERRGGKTTILTPTLAHLIKIDVLNFCEPPTQLNKNMKTETRAGEEGGTLYRGASEVIKQLNINIEIFFTTARSAGSNTRDTDSGT